MQQLFYVYILTNKKYGVLYVGKSNDLIERIYQHKNKQADGFTKKYNLTQLVYYEVYESAIEATHREKCIKEWKRNWKLELIEKMNPEWRDLYDDICK
jgi:putative endonuclease